LRPAPATQQVASQPGIHTETLSIKVDNKDGEINTFSNIWENAERNIKRSSSHRRKLIECQACI
jgi:hypothetical protein